MEELNNKYDIKIEVLTPLSIGAGAEKDWVKGVDFVKKNGSVYKLSLRKMFANGIDVAKLSSLFEKKDDNGILQLVDKKLDNVSDGVWKSSITSENPVKSFIKNQLSNKPIIPGSSLKGAIRSVLFQYFKGNSKDGKEVFGSSTNGDEFMRFIKLSDIEFDSTELVNTKIFNLQGGNGQWQGGWKHGGTSRDGNSHTDSTFNPIGFNTIYESLVPSQSAYGTIMLSETAFNLFDWSSFYEKEENENSPQKKDVQLLKDKIKIKKDLLSDVKQKSIYNLFEVVNNHTRNYLQKEKAFFEQYVTDKTSEIIYSINHLLSQITDDNTSCILKMSAGSGFHSITGDWQFDDYSIDNVEEVKGKHISYSNHKKSAKSRKIAIYKDNFSLMGFIKISLLSDEEKREIEQIKKEEENRRAEERVAAAKKKEEEERLAKEFQQKQNEYNSLIESAKQEEDNQEYEAALSKYKQAEQLFPEGKKHLDAIVNIEELLRQKKEVIEGQKFIDNIKHQEEEARSKRLERGMGILTDKDVTGKFKICDFKRVKQEVERWLKQSGNQSIPSDQISILNDTLVRIYMSITKEKDKKPWIDANSNIWGDVKKWTSAEIANQIFIELIGK